MSNFRCPSCKDHYDYSDDLEHLHDLIRSAEMTHVEVDNKSLIYIYIPRRVSYTAAEQESLHKKLLEAFHNVFPQKTVCVGWYLPVEIRSIDEKVVFKGKLDGSIS